jgi:hypothetical protein
MTSSSRLFTALIALFVLIIPITSTVFLRNNLVAQAGGAFPITSPITPPVDPTATPSASPTASPESGSTNSGSTEVSAPGCADMRPIATHLLSVERVSATSVKLQWSKVERITHYSISFGSKHGEYIYGIDNTGNGTEFVVSSLVSNQNYYFVVYAHNGCAPSEKSNEMDIRKTFKSSSNSNGGSFHYSSNEEDVLGTNTGDKDDASATPSPTPAVVNVTPSATPSATPAPGRFGKFSPWMLILIIFAGLIIAFLALRSLLSNDEK